MENWFLVIEGLMYPSLSPLNLMDLNLLHFGINQGDTKSRECKCYNQIKYLLSYYIKNIRKCFSSGLFYCNEDSGQ